MSTTEIPREITALERDLLGRLGYWKDTRTAYHAAALAELMGRSLPKVTATLGTLRRLGYVRYFAGEGKAARRQVADHQRGSRDHPMSPDTEQER